MRKEHGSVRHVCCSKGRQYLSLEKQKQYDAAGKNIKTKEKRKKTFQRTQQTLVVSFPSTEVIIRVDIFGYEIRRFGEAIVFT